MSFQFLYLKVSKTMFRIIAVTVATVITYEESTHEM